MTNFKHEALNGTATAAGRSAWVRPKVERMWAGSAEDGAKPDHPDSGVKPS